MQLLDLIGIPYELGGCSESGADCWGLALLAYRKGRGIELPRYNQMLSGKRVPPRKYVETCAKDERARAWMEVPGEDVQAYDVVVLRHLRPFDHVGIVTEKTELLLTTDRGLGSHLCAWGPKTCWADRVGGIYRYVGA